MLVRLVLPEVPEHVAVQAEALLADGARVGFFPGVSALVLGNVGQRGRVAADLARVLLGVPPSGAAPPVVPLLVELAVVAARSGAEAVGDLAVVVDDAGPVDLGQGVVSAAAVEADRGVVHLVVVVFL